MKQRDEHFQGFAISLDRSIKRFWTHAPEDLFQTQKKQVETLVKLEREFKLALIRHSAGRGIYKRFVDYICIERGNILDARPYFRERQQIFTRDISGALRNQRIRALFKFNFNYRFIKFVLDAYDWRPRSQIMLIATKIKALRDELVVTNLPLAISRARIFFSRTPKAHLSHMDLVQIAVEGLISAVDKFVLPFSRAFRAVAIGRITGNFITSYSLHQDTVLNPCGQKPKKLKDFKYGDVVLGIDNFGDTVETEVVALHDHGVLKSFEITFDDGYRVTCSKNHKFLTKNGMVSIQEIVSGDMEVLCEPAAQAGWVDSPLREGIWNQKRVFRAQESVRDLLGNRSTEASFGNIYGTRQERNAGAFGHELFYQRGETQRGVEGLAYSYAPLTSTGDLVLRKVVRVRSVGLCRMYDLEVAHPKHNFLLPNGVVTSNSETPIHFYPREKRKIYRANKAVGRGSIDHEEIACEVNKGVEKVHCTTASEISNLMSAASVVSADASSQEEGTSVSIRQIERYAAPVESQPDVITEKNDVMAKLFVAETKLSTTQRKVLKLRGVEVDSL